MEKIKALIQSRPYESDTLQVLEAFVATEYSSNSEGYDFEANKALIKIYQAFPEHRKNEVLGNIFEMALLRSDVIISIFIRQSRMIYLLSTVL